jgi:hypothetical protein
VSEFLGHGLLNILKSRSLQSGSESPFSGLLVCFFGIERLFGRSLGKLSRLWFANIRFADSGLTFISIWSKNRGLCQPSPCSCFVLRDSSSAVMRPWRRRMLLFLLLAAFQRQRRRPVLTSLDRLF